jgi:branched-chain amino acid aminotransferase
MSDPIFYVNGRYTPAQDAMISATDLAVMRGYGIFESLRTYGSRPFRLDEHLERLEKSAEAVGLHLSWTRTFLSEVVHETLSRNGYPESRMRIVVTGGESENYFTPAGKPGLIVMASPLNPFPQSYYQKGIKVATAEVERYLPLAKTIDYIPGVMMLKDAQSMDPDIFEVLFINRHGHVTEGITSNVFAFFDDILATPEKGILLGVTRQVVLELAEPYFTVDPRDIQVNELRHATEIFITASVKEIMPVRALDGQVVGEGGPGANTKRLMKVFQQMAQDFIEKGSYE